MIRAPRALLGQAGHRGWGARAAGERGLTLVEVLVAALVLVIGLLGAFDTFNGSGRAIVSAERVASMTQVAQQELAAVEALPYANVADSSTPTKTTTTDKTNPTYYLSTCTAGTCYQWDPTSSGSVETLDVDSTNGKVAPGPTTVVVPGASVTGCTTTSTSPCQITLFVYVFVTETTDSVCSQTGVSCSGTISYKRVTVAVKIAGTGNPKQPVVLQAFVSPKIGGSANPLTSASTTCLDGSTSVPCTH